MISNLLNAIIFIGSLILIAGYNTYRRGPADQWANRALLCLAIVGLFYAPIGVICHGHIWGISSAGRGHLHIIQSDLGGAAVGIFLCLILSGQLWKISSRKKNEEPK